MTIHQLEGAAREAIVAADLMRRGFEVFKTVCSQSTFDLVVYKNDSFLRIEVKGENKAPRTGPVATLKGLRNTDCRKFDILAAVDGQRVRYLRSVLHTFNTTSKELVGKETVNTKTRKDLTARRQAMEKKC